MMIENQYLQKIKDLFEEKVEYSNIRIDVDYPFFNVYEWQGELLFSNGYRAYHDAVHYSSKEFFQQIPKCWNALENKIKWMGVLNGAKVIIDKDY